MKGSAPRSAAAIVAAESIVAGAHYRLDDLAAYSSDVGFVRWLLERAFAGGRLRATEGLPAKEAAGA